MTCERFVIARSGYQAPAASGESIENAVAPDSERLQLLEPFQAPEPTDFQIMPLLFILFFCLAGAHLRLSDLPRLGVVGAAYVLARSAGLIGGSRLGGSIGRIDTRIKKWIGLGILSQAGVAIGLSLMISSEFSQLGANPEVAAAVERFGALHPGVGGLVYDPLTIGAAVITVITATSIIFEIVGPILTKIALTRAGEIGADE